MTLGKIIKSFIIIFFMNISFNFVNSFHDSNKTCNILSFSGGGSYGAVEIGILSQISLDKYDMITGVSAGGLNAGFLSYYNNDNTDFYEGIEYLSNIYINMKNSDVYEHNFDQIQKTWSYYDTSPLKQTIEKELLKMTHHPTKPTLIGSTNLNTGFFEIFKFNQKQDKKDQVDIMMATSAIPFIFPPQKISNNYYVDGGVISNEILNGIDGYLPSCNYYNITFIVSGEKINQIESILSFEEYTKRIIQTILNDFNNEFIEIAHNKCSYPKGKINYCYASSDELKKYSLLDFSHGKELFEIGKNKFICEEYVYC